MFMKTTNKFIYLLVFSLCSCNSFYEQTLEDYKKTETNSVDSSRDSNNSRIREIEKFLKDDQTRVYSFENDSVNFTKAVFEIFKYSSDMWEFYATSGNSEHHKNLEIWTEKVWEYKVMGFLFQLRSLNPISKSHNSFKRHIKLIPPGNTINHKKEYNFIEVSQVYNYEYLDKNGKFLLKEDLYNNINEINTVNLKSSSCELNVKIRKVPEFFNNSEFSVRRIFKKGEDLFIEMYDINNIYPTKNIYLKKHSLKNQNPATGTIRILENAIG